MSTDLYTSAEKLRLYQATSGVFQGLFSEIKEFSKKKAEATLSEKKVKLLNLVLADLLVVLADEPEAKFLELLDDDDLPQNSDAVLIMVQFHSALRSFYSRYYAAGYGEHYWRVEGNEITDEAEDDLDYEERSPD